MYGGNILEVTFSVSIKNARLGLDIWSQKKRKKTPLPEHCQNIAGILPEH
jgi:hypothetical protein